MSGYPRLHLTVPAAAEERLIGELWAAGTLGLETRERGAGELEVLAYFQDRRAARSCLTCLARSCPEAELASPIEEIDGDWLAVYRRRARPFPLGGRLEVDPGEPLGAGARPPAPGRHRLHLPARQAFGTGEHESTQLVIELVEELDLEGLDVLDLGCGSGILSFASLLFGARSVVGLEIEPVAAFTARANQALNALAFPVVVGRASSLRPARAFDLALVNVLPGEVRPDLPALRALLVPRGRAVFSGILGERADAVGRDLADNGFEAHEIRVRGEWAALACTVVPRRFPARPSC